MPLVVSDSFPRDLCSQQCPSFVRNVLRHDGTCRYASHRFVSHRRTLIVPCGHVNLPRNIPAFPASLIRDLAVRLMRMMESSWSPRMTIGMTGDSRVKQAGGSLLHDRPSLALMSFSSCVRSNVRTDDATNGRCYERISGTHLVRRHRLHVLRLASRPHRCECVDSPFDMCKRACHYLTAAPVIGILLCSSSERREGLSNDLSVAGHMMKRA